MIFLKNEKTIMKHEVYGYPYIMLDNYAIPTNVKWDNIKSGFSPLTIRETKAGKPRFDFGKSDKLFIPKQACLEIFTEKEAQKIVFNMGWSQEFAITVLEPNTVFTVVEKSSDGDAFTCAIKVYTWTGEKAEKTILPEEIRTLIEMSGIVISNDNAKGLSCRCDYERMKNKIPFAEYGESLKRFLYRPDGYKFFSFILAEDAIKHGSCFEDILANKDPESPYLYAFFSYLDAKIIRDHEPVFFDNFIKGILEKRLLTHYYPKNGAEVLAPYLSRELLNSYQNDKFYSLLIYNNCVPERMLNIHDFMVAHSDETMETWKRFFMRNKDNLLGILKEIEPHLINKGKYNWCLRTISNILSEIDIQDAEVWMYLLSMDKVVIATSVSVWYGGIREDDDDYYECKKLLFKEATVIGNIKNPTPEMIAYVEKHQAEYVPYINR